MTEKPASKPKNAGNPNWVKGMKSPNPEGRRLENTRKEQIEKVIAMTPAMIVKMLGGRDELTQAFKRMPPDVPLWDLIVLRVASAVMFEPQPGLVNFLFDSIYGKVKEAIDVTVTKPIEYIEVERRAATNDGEREPVEDITSSGPD